jgi:hypothetical protein
MRSLLLAAAALLPIAAAAADPTADTTGVLAVAEPPGPGVELVDLTRALRATIAEQMRGVLPPDELRQRMTGHVSTATLTELDRAYQGAVAASQAGDYEGAARTLGAVVQDLEQLPESQECFAQWSRALLRLARTEGSLGHKGESRELLERLVRADPAVKVDPDQYPPSFVKQVDEVRTALRAGPQRKLTVTAAGAPARVFVEGRAVGSTPITLTVAAGSYRVSGAAGAARVAPRSVDLTQEDQSLALDLRVAEAYCPDAGPGLALAAPQRSGGIITAGAALKLDRALTVSVATDGDVRYLVGSLYDVRKGSLLREGRLRLTGWAAPAGGMQALGAFLVRGESSNLVIPAGAKPDLAVKPSNVVVAQPTEAKAAQPKPGGSSTKGWVAIGAAGVAVGLGVFAVVENNKSSSYYSQAAGMLNPDGTPGAGWDPAKYQQLRNDGASAKQAAQISAGAAIVSLGVSGVLGFLSYKQTGEIGPFRF